MYVYCPHKPNAIEAFMNQDEGLWQRVICHRRWHHFYHLHHRGRRLSIPLRSSPHPPLYGTAHAWALVAVHGGSIRGKRLNYSAFLGPILWGGITEQPNHRAVRNQAILVRRRVFVSAVQPQDVKRSLWVWFWNLNVPIIFKFLFSFFPSALVLWKVCIEGKGVGLGGWVLENCNSRRSVRYI